MKGEACYSVPLTHWGRVTHICVSELTIIGSDNDLSPGRHQAIIWTNDGILLIRPLGTNFSEILFGIQTFSFNKMHLKMSSAKWRPFCLGLNVLTHWGRVTHKRLNKFSIIGSDNCLPPGRHRAIIWTNAGILLTGPLGTNFNGIYIQIDTFKLIHSRKSISKRRMQNCGHFASASMCYIQARGLSQYKDVVLPV